MKVSFMFFNSFCLLLISQWNAGFVQSYTWKRSYKLQSFSWNKCASNEVIKVDSFTISPDPIIIPGNVSVGFQATLSQTEYSPLPLSLTVKKKVAFIWVKVPCEKGFGSCTYNDFCAQMPNPCPTVFKQQGINCTCPIGQGTYNVPVGPVLYMSSSVIPSWLESGDYWIEARVKDHSGNEILCLDVNLSLKYTRLIEILRQTNKDDGSVMSLMLMSIFAAIFVNFYQENQWENSFIKVFFN